MELLDLQTSLIVLGIVLGGVAVLLRTRAARRSDGGRKKAPDATDEEAESARLCADLIDDPDERDLAALEVIGAYSRRVLRRARATPMSLGHMQDLTSALIRDVAAQYHPLSERPELEATIEDLLDMNRRVLDRVYGLLDRFPFDRLRGMRLNQAQDAREGVDRIYESGAARFVRRHPAALRTVRWGLMVYHRANPFYWARRGAFLAGREMALRKLLATTVRVVGTEAMLLYSQRDVRSERVTLERKAAREMINVALADGKVTAREYEEVLAFVVGNAVLDAESKVALLRALVGGKVLERTGLESVTTERDRRRVEQAVQRIVGVSEVMGEGKRRHVERIRAALAGGGAPVVPGTGLAAWKRRFRTIWAQARQGGRHHGRKTSAHPDSRERHGQDGRVSRERARTGEGA